MGLELRTGLMVLVQNRAASKKLTHLTFKYLEQDNNI